MQTFLVKVRQDRDKAGWLQERIQVEMLHFLAIGLHYV